jgi:hypothetical protein
VTPHYCLSVLTWQTSVDGTVGPISTRTLLIALPPQSPWAVALEVLEVAARVGATTPTGWMVSCCRVARRDREIGRWLTTESRGFEQMTLFRHKQAGAVTERGKAQQLWLSWRKLHSLGHRRNMRSVRFDFEIFVHRTHSSTITGTGHETLPRWTCEA